MAMETLEKNKFGKIRFLICTRGCTYDTNQHFHQHIKQGTRCKNILTYALYEKTTYCQRIIKVDYERGYQKSISEMNL